MDEKCLWFRREEKTVGEVCIVERLLSEPIPCQKQAASPTIPEREGKHPLQSVQTPRAVLGVGMEDDLDISPGQEYMSPCTEVFTQAVCVVDFPIGDQVQTAIQAGERLPAGD